MSPPSYYIRNRSTMSVFSCTGVAYKKLFDNYFLSGSQPTSHMSNPASSMRGKKEESCTKYHLYRMSSKLAPEETAPNPDHHTLLENYPIPRGTDLTHHTFIELVIFSPFCFSSNFAVVLWTPFWKIGVLKHTLHEHMIAEIFTTRQLVGTNPHITKHMPVAVARDSGQRGNYMQNDPDHIIESLILLHQLQKIEILESSRLIRLFSCNTPTPFQSGTGQFCAMLLCQAVLTARCLHHPNWNFLWLYTKAYTYTYAKTKDGKGL